MNLIFKYPRWAYWPLALFFIIISGVILKIEDFSIDTVFLSTASLLLGLGFLMYTSMKTPWYAPLLIRTAWILILLEAILRTKVSHIVGPIFIAVCMIGIFITLIQMIFIIHAHKDKKDPR